MQHFGKPTAPRWLPAVLTIALSFTACASPDGATGLHDNRAIPPTESQRPTATPTYEAFSDFPPEARTASRGGDPRTAAYWALWNTCAPENRAGVATANGGRAAGWVLVDDLLADPGIQLGDYPVTTCAEGLNLLEGRSTAGEATVDPIYDLAAQLLAAELNLNVGAESCPLAEEAVQGGHFVLSQVGFDGTGDYDEISSEIADAALQLVALLEGYSRGELCR